MKKHSGVLLGAVCVMMTASGCGAQENTARRIAFDFEPVKTLATQPDSVHIGPADVFTEERGHGWTRVNSIDRAHDRDTPDSPFYFQRKDFALYDLVRDGVTVVGENTFTAKVPNGTYRATLYLGDFSPNEERPDLFAKVNGLTVANNETTPGGVVKAFTFPLTVSDGKVILVVEGRGPQKYLPVNGLVLEPAPESEFKVTVATLPEKQPTAENYALGWTRFVEAFRQDWETAKSQMKAEGTWSENWKAASPTGKDARRVFSSGEMRLDDIAKRAGGTIDLKEYSAILREIGVDGMISNNAVSHKQLPQRDLQVAVMGPGYELLPAGAYSRVDFPKILDRKTGEISVMENIYTPTSPGARDFFREDYVNRFAPLMPTSSFLAIDEIRGLWSAGTTMGDYSDVSQKAFTEWARAQNIKLSSETLPRPARSWDFYHFYRFRMGAVPRFMRSFVRDSVLEKQPLFAGNGFLGPETVNHNSLWGPDAVKEGFGLASWDYDGNKASAEFLAAMEREHNASVQNWTAFWREPILDLSHAAVVASAATRSLNYWHQGSFIQSGDRVAWMKTAYLATRLAHATGGAQHDTGVYLWAPDSLVFNDLVGDVAKGEAGHWKEISDLLGKGNLDFKVTHTLQVPQSSLVIYAPVRSVLRPDEADALTKFINGGGTLLFASDSQPETPDAKPLTALRAALQKPNVTRAKVLDVAAARSLAQTRKVALNPTSDAPSVRTFAYSRGPQKEILFVNTDAKNPARVSISEDGLTDVFSTQKIARGALEIPAGHYRLLRQTAGR